MFLTEKKKEQKKGWEKVMFKDAISNNCDIHEAFINSANITPSKFYIYIYVTIFNYIYTILSQYTFYIIAVLRVTTRNIV